MIASASYGVRSPKDEKHSIKARRGIALATGVIYDHKGLIGHSLQSLLLDARQ